MFLWIHLGLFPRALLLPLAVWLGTSTVSTFVAAPHGTVVTTAPRTRMALRAEQEEKRYHWKGLIYVGCSNYPIFVCLLCVCVCLIVQGRLKRSAQTKSINSVIHHIILCGTSSRVTTTTKGEVHN